ncbi:probable inactive methyltransferase Os04g0175900 [Phragmites australis]|uniref:probable inactive methyltransferase Os04g0175900 n=1 Tax=Phragmites australis TaxID=29695 RepID=UPI002D77F525|nr:probable inactive methyltransferase Os04g0175900 [Phragmites australis]
MEKIGFVNGAGEDEDATCLHAQTLVYAYNVTMTIKAAVELGLFDALSAADGRALTPDELAVRVTKAEDKTQSAALIDRMLRFLASFDVVRCSTETGPDGTAFRRYTPAPVCRWLTNNNSEGSLAPMSAFSVDEDNISSWHHIAEAVADGGRHTPFEKAHDGVPAYEYFGKNRRLSMLFDRAMAHQSLLVVRKLVEHPEVFDGVRVLVDVGGGTGETLAMIRDRYKHIRGINLELSHVVAEAPSLPGVEHVAGDMFESIPTGDAVFLKWMLHMFNDEECHKILKNCHRALPENGKVIVIQSVLPETPESTPAARDSHTMDIIILVNFKGGKERTEKEYAKLATDAGFTGFRSTYIFCNFYALEFAK